MSQAPRIHPLPPLLANQIAAGEVVERPASVLKELIENSLDAGATQIEIVVEGAGSQRLWVRDNGHGIVQADLPLALARHATSKLSHSDQLACIGSLGFRGEALPSIASVSNLTLRSKPEDQACGYAIKAHTQTLLPVAHPTGTSVEVRDLFFNVPARRRFLRSPKTELLQIQATLYRLALSHFAVGFSWQLDQQPKVSLPRADTDALRMQRIQKLCGQRFLSESLTLQQEYEDLRLSGWISLPEAHRASTDVQYFFINGRVVRDRLIQHAIRQAYADQLPAGRQPGYLLALELPLDQVDVNVHPTKHEVRFRQARLVHGLITRAIEDALQQAPALLGAAPAVSSAEPSAPSQRAHTIAQTRPSYHAQPSAAPTSAHDQASMQWHGWIEQRYAWIQIGNDHALIDGQQATQSLRMAQLAEAWQQGTLRPRPILVPLDFPASQAFQAGINQYAEWLAQHGWSIQTHAQGLRMLSMPQLLSGLALSEQLAGLEAFLSQQISETELLSRLQTALAQSLAAQAVAWPALQSQISSMPIEQVLQAAWCRRLDSVTLSGLFSTASIA